MSVQPIAPNALGSDCPQLLYQLGNYTCESAQNKRTPLALIGDMGAFNSPFYTGFNPLEPTMIEGNKIKQVRLQILKRLCENELDDCATVDPCTVEATDQYDEYLVDFAPVCSVKKISVTPSDFQRTCTGVQTGILERILRTIDALNRDHEQKLMAQVIAGAGGNVEGPVLPGAYRTIASFIDANGLLNANAIHTLNEDLLVNEADGCTAIAVGGLKTALGKADAIRRWGCCNDAGVDQQRIADELGFAFFKSKTIEAAFNAAGNPTPQDAVALIHPGSVQHIEWFKYAGDGAYTHGLSAGMIYQDPMTGIRYDMKVRFEDCDSNGDESYTITISKNSMAYVVPTDMYQACDPLTNINGVWLYNLAQ